VSSRAKHNEYASVIFLNQYDKWSARHHQKTPYGIRSNRVRTSCPEPLTGSTVFWIAAVQRAFGALHSLSRLSHSGRYKRLGSPAAFEVPTSQITTQAQCSQVALVREKSARALDRFRTLRADEKHEPCGCSRPAILILMLPVRSSLQRFTSGFALLRLLAPTAALVLGAGLVDV
jgi:hypothetical protein